MLDLMRDTCHICLEIQRFRDSYCDLSALLRIGASLLARAVVSQLLQFSSCVPFW